MKTWQITDKTVKLQGRTLDDNGTRWLIMSASGFECGVHAKEMSLTLKGDSTAHPTRQPDGKPEMNQARYALYVDGILIQDSCMDESQKTLVVFKGDTERDAIVQFLKLSEGTQSYLGVKEIITDDDASISPTPEKRLKIEFIGDSITCGYGVEGKSAEELFTTRTENATKAYAYLTAKNLDADCSLVSFSGFGVVSGWTNDGNINTIQLVPSHYKKFCFCWNGDMFKDHEWDFSKFQPQIVVINLGTNDDSYTQDNIQKQNEYVSCYVNFIKTVRALNPQAKIVLALGIMTGGNRLIPSMQKAAQEYIRQTGDKNIDTYSFTSQTQEEGFGSDFHPSEATQTRCALEFTEYLRGLGD
ncbi:MAG: hypothetical protein J5857_02970 [Treponema sp.]|nr:hypothetical protein [Treponema sp.]